jgi:hypothetical protein
MAAYAIGAESIHHLGGRRRNARGSGSWPRAGRGALGDFGDFGDFGGEGDRAAAGARSGTGSDSAQIKAWVEGRFTAKTVGGSTVYDLTAPVSGS